jgi:hypothetical protein
MKNLNIQIIKINNINSQFLVDVKKEHCHFFAKFFIQFINKIKIIKNYNI